MEAIVDGVTEHAERGRFELAFDGGTAFAEYRADGDRVVLIHTEVPQAAAGQGIGSRLARGIFEIVRKSGRKVVIRCPFIAEWIKRHPEYDDLVAG